MNWAFSWLLSVTVGFSQPFYALYHIKNHQGNSDRPDERGESVDLISIYRYSHDGEPKNPWTYTFLSSFRGDPMPFFKDFNRSHALC